MGLYYFLYILSFIAIGFTLFTSFYVNSSFDKYSKNESKSQLSGKDVARRILDSNGLHNVYIGVQSGKLSDHFISSQNVINLSEEVYYGTGIAAHAVAAHECGHALQFKDGNFFMKIKSFIFPAVIFSTKYAFTLFTIGMILSSFSYKISNTVMFFSIIAYLFCVIFQVVTLPIEIEASERAKKELVRLNILDNDEKKIASKVLFAAALTYVAGLTVTLIEFLKLLVIFLNNRNRDRD